MILPGLEVPGEVQANEVCVENYFESDEWSNEPKAADIEGNRVK